MALADVCIQFEVFLKFPHFLRFFLVLCRCQLVKQLVHSTFGDHDLVPVHLW